MVKATGSPCLRTSAAFKATSKKIEPSVMMFSSLNGDSAMQMCPIDGPNEGQAFSRLRLDLLIEEFRAALIENVVEIGHENEVAVRRGEHLADSLGVPLLIAGTRLVILKVDVLGDPPRIDDARGFVFSI
jgi:hypothetical protein